jgi:hypothetical protein
MMTIVGHVIPLEDLHAGEDEREQLISSNSLTPADMRAE